MTFNFQLLIYPVDIYHIKLENPFCVRAYISVLLLLDIYPRCQLILFELAPFQVRLILPSLLI